MDINRKIDQFLDKDLEKSEMDSFGKEIQQDEQLAQELNFMEEINESIIDDEVFYLRQKLNLLVNQSSARIPLYKTITGVAAGIIIIFSIITITKQPDPIKAFNQYYSPYQSDMNKRSANTEITGLQFGIKLYEEGDYETALKIFENYTEENVDSPPGKYYLALTALGAEEHKLAQSCLIQLIETNDYSYSLHAKWYLGMLYLKTNQTEKAKPIFEELSETENYYSARAKKILKRHI